MAVIKGRVPVAAPTAISTATILCGLALTSLLLPQDDAEGVFAAAGIGVGLSLALATGIEATAGVRALIRVDILMLWALYGLTFLEFLFPQRGTGIGINATLSSATIGTYAVLLGFAGLVVGRHWVPRRGRPRQISTSMEVRPANIFLLFVFAALLGYLHIFLAVDFDLFEALRQMSLPRFAQAWSRGRYGDALSLLVELGALIYLIPPIAGLIYARSAEYNLAQKMIVTIVLLFTFYYGFSSGTRNILATYVITFVGAYFLNKPKLNFWHVLCYGVPTLVLLALGTAYMLEFRQVGLGDFSFQESRLNTLYVDQNMVVISRITDLFPNVYNYLGLEIPFYGVIHPIPRMLWPGKPEGLSVSLESALGADPTSVTFASTFVGEAYMAGGLLAVLFAGLLYGAMGEMWNRLSRDINSPFQQLLYASGFFCAALSMRSTVWTSVAALPTLALWLFGKLWLSSARRPAAGISSNRSSVHCLRSGYPPDKG